MVVKTKHPGPCTGLDIWGPRGGQEVVTSEREEGWRKGFRDSRLVFETGLPLSHGLTFPCNLEVRLNDRREVGNWSRKTPGKV